MTYPWDKIALVFSPTLICNKESFETCVCIILCTFYSIPPHREHLIYVKISKQRSGAPPHVRARSIPYLETHQEVLVVEAKVSVLERLRYSQKRKVECHLLGGAIKLEIRVVNHLFVMLSSLRHCVNV